MLSLISRLYRSHRKKYRLNLKSPFYNIRLCHLKVANQILVSSNTFPRNDNHIHSNKLWTTHLNKKQWPIWLFREILTWCKHFKKTEIYSFRVESLQLDLVSRWWAIFSSAKGVRQLVALLVWYDSTKRTWTPALAHWHLQSRDIYWKHIFITLLFGLTTNYWNSLIQVMSYLHQSMVWTIYSRNWSEAFSITSPRDVLVTITNHLNPRELTFRNEPLSSFPNLTRSEYKNHQKTTFGKWKKCHMMI